LRRRLDSALEALSAPPSAISREDALATLTEVFGGDLSFDSDIRIVSKLLGAPFDPAADPLSVPAVVSLLEQQSGSVLHRVAALLNLPLPAPTKDTHLGYGR
jgi:hypothetical protein